MAVKIIKFDIYFRAIRNRKLNLTLIDNGITMAHPQQLIDYKIVNYGRPSILNLNDDCLLHICQYLDLVDIIRFSTTCERLKECSELYFFKKYKNLDTSKIKDEDKMLKPIKLKVMLMKVGESVNSFVVSKNDLCGEISHWTYLTIINQYCFNLQRLTLNGLQIMNYTNFAKSMFSNLTSLKLISCNVSVDNFIQRIIESNKNSNCKIQTLHIENDLIFNGLTLKQLHNLNEVSFINCSHLYPPYVGEIFVKNAIKSLTIRDCENFKNASAWFRDVIDYIGNLEYLNTNHELFKWHGVIEQRVVYPMERAKKLTQFHIENIQEDVTNIICKLADIDQLTHLNMSQCTIKDKQIRKAFKYFTKLEKVNLNNNVNVDDELLIDLARNCKLQQIHCKGNEIQKESIFEIVKLSSNLEILEVGENMIDEDILKKIITFLSEHPDRPRLEMIDVSLPMMDMNYVVN